MKKYQIIYADPPWEYKQSGSVKNSRGMAKQQYSTMSTKEICTLKVSEISEDGGVLLIWATFPNIGEALKVIEAWGFIYKTAAFVWVKKNKNLSNFWGMGAYSRANSEVCLLAIKKRTKAKQIVKSHAVHQIVESVIEKHSKKPEEVRQRIVKLFGDVSKVELFARQKTEGWDIWGNELENDVELITN